MTIKSLFVPPYAMQGEEIPAHILWESLDYDLIKIVLPDVVKLKAVFNVGEKMFNISDRTVTINEVEVEGYLGMLFSTDKLKERQSEFRFDSLSLIKMGKQSLTNQRWSIFLDLNWKSLKYQKL